MKKIFFWILLISSQKVFSQLSLTCVTERQVCLEYINITCDTAYFINPLLYVKQKRRQKEIISYLRPDMYDVVGDTLQISFTDTTLSKYNYIFPKPDKSVKENREDLVVILPPKSKMVYRIFFMRKFKYSFFEIKYNFGFRKSDFLGGENQFPVSVKSGKR